MHNYITAKIICDSITTSGDRMTTMEIEYPRFILAELNTHRMLSKNSASSRAIPTSAMENYLQAAPVYWGKNQPGMQAKEEIENIELAKEVWDACKKSAVSWANIFKNLGLHKQLTNRVTEPFMVMKTVISGTEWANFFHLRNHEDAQPEIRELAKAMYNAMLHSKPMILNAGEWHLPYIDTRRDKLGNVYYLDSQGNEISLEDARIISVSCCAQVSYRKQDDTLDKAVKIYLQLIESEPAHASPVEHQATPIRNTFGVMPFNPNTWEPGVTHVTADKSLWSGNLKGWVQFRKLIPNEAVWGKIKQRTPS